ncbi:MAG: translation initiation factor IF-3 [Aquificae bacterium]|nr:translation initiation factor IF-3 [Aquificota bacterium]
MSSLEKRYRVNRQIRAREVRVIDENGQNLGIMPIREALALAEEKGLDLIEIAPNAKPPVCKIADYGKFKYEMKKKAKEAKKKQKTIEVKELKMRVGIEEHDYQVKLKQLKEFLEEGNKVKLRIIFRGRENIRPELGERLVQRFAEDAAEYGELEKKPSKEGRFMIAVFAPKKKK